LKIDHVFETAFIRVQRRKPYNTVALWN